MVLVIEIVAIKVHRASQKKKKPNGSEEVGRHDLSAKNLSAKTASFLQINYCLYSLQYGLY